MQRRSFLQSVAAAFGVSVMGVSGRQIRPNVTIDYSLFTCPWSRRYDVSDPWSRDEVVYASDSRILVSHPGELTGTGRAKVPDLSLLWWDEFESAGWTPLGREQWMRRAAGMCPTCCGTGRVGNRHRCHCNRDECLACEYHDGWYGGQECPECSGDIEVDYCESVMGKPFSAGYMARLRTLGSLHVKAIQEERGYSVLAYRGDQGIRGFLMGLA